MKPLPEFVMPLLWTGLALMVFALGLFFVFVVIMAIDSELKDRQRIIARKALDKKQIESRAMYLGIKQKCEEAERLLK